MPRLSLIIPTRDRPLLLERALRSVIAQDMPPDEVIVVDDGRTNQPPLGDLALRSIRQACLARVHVIPNRRGAGVSGARNSGADHARGELLAFLDDDDELAPTYLRSVVAQCGAAGAAVACTDLLLCREDGSTELGKRAPDRLVADAFLTRNAGLIGSNLVIERGLYCAVGGFDESLQALEDRDFAIRLSQHPEMRYAAVHEPLTRHHLHSKPRLCTRRGAAMRAGVQRFYAVHQHRMSEAQRAEFRTNIATLWGLDEHGRDLD